MAGITTNGSMEKVLFEWNAERQEKGLSEVCLETVFIACLRRFIFRFFIRSKFNLLVSQRASLTRIFSWLKKWHFSNLE